MEYEAWLIFLGALLGTAVVLRGAKWLLDRHVGAASGRRFGAQMTMLALSFAGVLVILLLLPLKEEGTRGDLLTVLGILLSAAIALSATTFLGNLLAGLMMRSVRNFRIGDFLRCGEHFGRVTERGMFHTEIQTEDRDLTTLPNLHLATHPMTVIRTSGTIVSATVSLGYDVPRRRVRELLEQAAGDAGLAEPFAEVRELGDFSVTYRVAGLLTEVKTLISTRSKLRGAMMDRLHGAGVEIVSPRFMNQRAQAPGTRAVPRREDASADPEVDSRIEEVAFDKADLAESLDELERRREALKAERAEAEASVKSADEPERARLAAKVDSIARRIEAVEEVIRGRSETLESEDEPEAFDGLPERRRLVTVSCASRPSSPSSSRSGWWAASRARDPRAPGGTGSPGSCRWGRTRGLRRAPRRSRRPPRRPRSRGSPPADRGATGRAGGRGRRC